MLENDFFILLDWDNIGYHEMLERVKAWLLPDKSIQEIDVRASPSLNSYHIYINTFSYLNPTLIFRMRFAWHDDYQKLCMDMLNKKARHRGDLFSKHVIIRNGIKHEFKEIKMFKYFRYGSKEQWQVINRQLDLVKNSQLVL